MTKSLAGTVALGALLVVAAVTAIGVAALWPSDADIERPASLRTPDAEAAEVVGIRAVPCRTPQATDCRRLTVELGSGPDEGERVQLTVGDQGDRVEISVGDAVRVYRNQLPEGAVIGGVPVDPYSFADFERRQPLVLLILLFVVVVILMGRLRGLRALGGLAASVVIIVLFIVPAILDGRSPVAVALFGALAVMLVTIPLAHGLGPKSVAACLGTTLSLVLTLTLAVVATELAHLSGLSSDEAVFLRATADDLSIKGLLLAGMVIGALGVLDDLTVTQASTVMALRRANPALRARQLFGSALEVGHDHIAATVNTLVLAYAGAALPVLLVFSVAGTSATDALNTEAVAEEVVGMLVGSIGLVAAVPITTGLAALLAVRIAPDVAGRGAHAHPH